MSYLEHVREIYEQESILIGILFQVGAFDYSICNIIRAGGRQYIRSTSEIMNAKSMLRSIIEGDKLNCQLRSLGDINFVYKPQL